MAHQTLLANFCIAFIQIDIIAKQILYEPDADCRTISKGWKAEKSKLSLFGATDELTDIVSYSLL